MSAEVAIRAEGFALVLRAEAYQFPEIASGSDANWLTGDAELRAEGDGVFEARLRLWLFTEDLARFRDELRVLDRDLSGQATLKHLEGQVQIVIALTSGRGSLNGFIREHVGPCLTFDRVATDQTYLRETLAQLDALLVTFPVRSAPHE